MKTVIALAVAAIFAPTVAGAQLVHVTPEVFGRMRKIAEDARAKHPTSPSEAANYFSYTFNGEFGDVMPTAESHLVQTPALTVVLTTPINLERARFFSALNSLDTLPDKPAPVPSVGITVTPKQMDAPNITRVVLFRGTAPVEPISQGLEAREFTNRMGAKTTLSAGVVLYPLTAFAPGETLKVVLITNNGPIERELNAQALARMK